MRMTMRRFVVLSVCDILLEFLSLLSPRLSFKDFDSAFKEVKTGVIKSEAGFNSRNISILSCQTQKSEKLRANYEMVGIRKIFLFVCI